MNIENVSGLKTYKTKTVFIFQKLVTKNQFKKYFKKQTISLLPAGAAPSLHLLFPIPLPVLFLYPRELPAYAVDAFSYNLLNVHGLTDDWVVCVKLNCSLHIVAHEVLDLSFLNNLALLGLNKTFKGAENCVIVTTCNNMFFHIHRRKINLHMLPGLCGSGWSSLHPSGPCFGPSCAEVCVEVL